MEFTWKEQSLKILGFSGDVTAAIACLTKVKGGNYEGFILRVSKNYLATKVKIEDVKDNMDLTRLKEVAPKDLARAEKYRKALENLQKGLK